jgi:hypothetical protein
MTDEAAINYINTFYDNKGNGFIVNNCTFNPLNKVVELYERMIKD